MKNAAALLANANAARGARSEEGEREGGKSEEMNGLVSSGADG